MKIDTSRFVGSMDSSEMRKSPSEKESLKVGDNLLGRVLEIKDSGKAVIDFGRFCALARTQFPVREGDVIDVRVLDKGPPLQLGLNNQVQKSSRQSGNFPGLTEFPSTNTLEKLRSETVKTINHSNGILKGREFPIYAKDILSRIATHFGRMNIGRNSSELSSQLKSYIENSGIFFEKKLENVIIKSFETNEKTASKELRQSTEIRDIIKNDIKPSILMLKDLLDRKGFLLRILGARDLEPLKSTMERFLSEMVTQQNDSMTRHDGLQSGHALTYALPLEESDPNARLRIYYSKKKKGMSKEGFKVSLMLTMDRIGRIRTDFHLIDENLHITFFVTNETIKEYVDHHSKEITKALQSHFKKLILSVIISEKEIEEFDRKEPGTMHAGLVNLRV